jgi:peptidyl-dipeptidase Dcp
MKILTTNLIQNTIQRLFENKKEDFLPAFIEGIALAKAEIDSIVKTKRHPLSKHH